MNQKSNVNCSANYLADLQQHNKITEETEMGTLKVFNSQKYNVSILSSILTMKKPQNPLLSLILCFFMRVQCGLLYWCRTANNDIRISHYIGFLSLPTDMTAFITLNNLLASLRIWSSSHFWRWLAQEKMEQCRSNLRKWNQKWQKTTHLGRTDFASTGAEL